MKIFLRKINSIVSRLPSSIIKMIGRILSNIIPKKNNLIVLEGTSSNRYNDNSRYLFEYLSKHRDLEVFWSTGDREVAEHVIHLGFKPLYSFFEKLWIMLRAKLVISSGTAYVNFFETTGPKTIKYCLQHGAGPKITYYLKNVKETIEAILMADKFDYMNFTSNYSAALTGKAIAKVAHQKIIVLGYPRNDHLFDKTLMDKCLKEKKFCHSLFADMNSTSRVILYTPTWRNISLCKLPLFDLADFNTEDFNYFLKENNLFMIYTTHPNAVLVQGMSGERIFQLNYKDYKTVDINQIMPEIDLLLNDYSTTSTDFAILDRPQLFVMPDYEDYLVRDCFAEDFKAILPGKEVFSHLELKKDILGQLRNPGEYSDRRVKLLNKYYDISLRNSSQLHYEFIKKILNI